MEDQVMAHYIRHKWICLTIAEPFPVDPRFPEGPFYNAGSTWYYSSRDAAYAERVAQYQRAAGFTVTVAVVER